MTVQIVTVGRKDVDDFFKLSDVFTAEWLTHTSLIVFIATEDAAQVRLPNRNSRGQPVTE